MRSRSARPLVVLLVSAAGAALAASGCGEPRKSPAPRVEAAEAPSPAASAMPGEQEPPQALRDGGAPSAASASASAAEEELVIVRPKPIDDLLVNPGIGLQTFQRFDGQPLNPALTWSEEGPVDPPADATARADYPASSIAYFRWFWSQIEPSPGT